MPERCCGTRAPLAERGTMRLCVCGHDREFHSGGSGCCGGYGGLGCGLDCEEYRPAVLVPVETLKMAVARIALFSDAQSHEIHKALDAMLGGR